MKGCALAPARRRQQLKDAKSTHDSAVLEIVPELAIPNDAALKSSDSGIKVNSLSDWWTVNRFRGSVENFARSVCSAEPYPARRCTLNLTETSGNHPESLFA